MLRKSIRLPFLPELARRYPDRTAFLDHSEDCTESGGAEHLLYRFGDNNPLTRIIQTSPNKETSVDV